MPSNPNSSTKKEEKRLNKKRKLEAFLNLVRNDGVATQPPKKSRESFTGSFKALKDELKKYQSKQNIEPTFYLKDIGRNALVTFSLSDKSLKCSNTIFFEDIYHLLMKALLGPLSPYDLKWATLERPQHITKIMVFEVEGLATHDILEINSELCDKSKIFQFVLKMVSSKYPFATELSTFHMSGGFYNYRENSSTSLFPTDNNSNSLGEICEENVISKLHLLLSPIQLAMENFPLPTSVFPSSRKCDNYVYSKMSYKPVTAESPMFALDCEMCLTCIGANEVTRVAIVDENLELVYHTLVKPENKIVNYLTKYSGVTEKMLQNVTTTLNDVHADLQRILPPDAILCGQSLNFDLHALKMIHPYVIDTSVIFNLSGVRERKSSLKHLTKIFLNEVIQNNKAGHHPVEDSIASMKLVQLKLQKGVEFGDAVIAPQNFATVSDKPKEKQSDLSILKSKFSNFVKLHSGPEHSGFFERITKFSKKKVCLIGNEDALVNYLLENPNDRVSKKKKSVNKKNIKSVIKNLNEFDILISHLTLKDETSSVNDIICGLKEVYESFPNRSLFLLIARNNASHCETLSHNYCMAGLKIIKE